MDTVTQIALGAAVGEATAGRQIGRKAPVWGGLIAALPDFDLFIPLGDVVSDFTYHRSWSHSILVMTAATPVLTWLLLKVAPSLSEHRRRVGLLVLLALITHTLLDCFTVYGTQPWWPISIPPTGWSTIFIIDPLYTLPLLIGVGGALVWRRSRPARATRINAIGLTLSCLYLGWTGVAKVAVERAARAEMARVGIANYDLLTVPAPFNSLLWRILAVSEGDYYEGYFSLVSGGTQPTFERHDSDPALLSPLEDDWAVRRLQWFTRGYYSVSRVDSEIVLTDLRMGTEPFYVFRFVVGSSATGQVHSVPPRRLRMPGWGFEQLEWMWHRLWSTLPQPHDSLLQ